MWGLECIGPICNDILGLQVVSFVERLSLLWNVHYQRFHFVYVATYVLTCF